MKKLYSLLKIFMFFPLFALICYAQTTPAADPEKIYLFDTDITVNTDGTIAVKEQITLNVKHQQIRRGIYRDFAISRNEKFTPVSLTMDNRQHPFFTEKSKRNLRVNFGDDDYIPKGIHTYIFTYTFNGAIDFYKNYDELYWNVTGNGWDFTIDKAKIQINLPPQVKVLKDGISLYTGQKDSKQNNTYATGELSYETSIPLQPYEGLTISVPFEKGAIIPQERNSTIIDALPVLIVIIEIILSIYCFIYFFTTWLKVGKDPSYKKIPQYRPPQGISPAFMRYLYTEGDIDSGLFACSLLHLAMQGYIEIKQLNNKDVMLTLLKEDTDNLSEDEIIIIKNLFNKTKTHTLKQYSSYKVFGTIKKEIGKLFSQAEKPYREENKIYKSLPSNLLILSAFIPALYAFCKGVLLFFNYDLPDLSLPMIDIEGDSSAIFMFIGAFMLFVINSLIAKGCKHGTFISWSSIGCFFMLISIFCLMFVMMQQSVLVLVCQAVFMITAVGFAVYGRYIGNVTQEGKELFFKIYGFKHYLKKAEKYRIAASSPLEDEKIFCDFLPFAFAFDMQNDWIHKFENILSAALIQQYTQKAGGAGFITENFTKSISRSSAPRPSSSGSSSSSRSSGSWGGGSSGGGHGSSGGGGR